jgi:hypothetical protein
MWVAKVVLISAAIFALIALELTVSFKSAGIRNDADASFLSTRVDYSGCVEGLSAASQDELRSFVLSAKAAGVVETRIIAFPGISCSDPKGLAERRANGVKSIIKGLGITGKIEATGRESSTENAAIVVGN